MKNTTKDVLSKHATYVFMLLLMSWLVQTVLKDIWGVTPSYIDVVFATFVAHLGLGISETVRNA